MKRYRRIRYTKFLCCTIQDKKWVCEYVYYYGDHFGFDDNDWRFKLIHKLRPRLQFLGYGYFFDEVKM